ncbi:AtpZ/AtpI family protein [Bombella mellum]|uniref:AtpZ/AtpI family protein n=1 Tax=Bombella mellum TaxID=2039288 RepID=UPI002DDBB3B4|nr:AtpZ/AtpI family protein [Bombella mellum]
MPRGLKTGPVGYFSVTDDDTTRRSQFDQRLARLEQKVAPRTPSPGKKRLSDQSSLGMAFRIASDMIAGIAVGLGIGYELDRWTGHRPLFIIVFAMLGMGAGLRNVWRVVNVMDVPENGAQKDGRSQRGQRIDD